MTKKIILILILVTSLLPFALADTVIVKEVSGKVETMVPGATAWQPATAGQEIDLGATISTGFNSTAVIDLNNSYLEVKPLTRMTVENLLEQEGTVTTKVYLKVGKVKAAVESSEGLTHDFKVRTATMTASVRGTEFVIDEFNAECIDGRIIVTFDSGRETLVFGGESSDGESALAGTFAVSPYTATDAEPSSVDVTSEEPGVATGTIEITYQ